MRRATGAESQLVRSAHRQYPYMKGNPALHTKDWSTSAALQSLLNSAIGAGLFSAAVVAGFAAVLHTSVPSLPAKNVSVDLQSLSWMAALNLRVEHIEPAPLIPPTIEEQTREALTEREMVRPMQIPVAIPAKPMKPNLRARAHAKPRVVAQALPTQSLPKVVITPAEEREIAALEEVTFPKTLPRVAHHEETVTEDRIVVQTAAPIRSIATEPSRELFEAAERARLQEIRNNLGRTFTAALNMPQRPMRELAIQDIQLPDSPEFLPDPVESVDSHLVAMEEFLPDPPQEEVAIVRESDVRLDAPPTLPEVVKVSQAAPARPEPVKRVHKKRIFKAKAAVAVSVPSTLPISKDMPLRKPVETVPETRPTIRLIPKSAATPIIQLDNQSRAVVPEIEKVVTASQGAQISVRVRPELVGPIPQMGPEAPPQPSTPPAEIPTNPIVTPAPLPTHMPAGQIVATNDYSKMSGYSRTTSAGIVVTTHANTPEGTRTAVQGPLPLQGPALPPAKVGPDPEITVQEPPVVSRALVQGPSFVEAFDWSSPVDSVDTEAVTIENPEGLSATTGRAGWMMAKAPQHLPTLYWLNGKSAPLISTNASILLSSLAGNGLSVQSGTGVVFGKVPSGWTVEISGRAERPVLLSAKNELVPAQSIEGDRYFAFLNTEPGAHLVYLVGALGKPNGAVAVPVLPGTASYLDLSIVMKKSVTGKVFDAETTTPKALKGAQVRVVGQASATAVTNERGEFSISNVSVISNYPLFVETDAATGFTHRYKVASGHERDLSLFRVGERQITQWLDQLEGGISSTSGIIVAATPKPVGLSTDHAVFPAAESLASGANLKPETYALSTSGQLQINTPLKVDAARFVTVQVPEGPTIVRLDDQRQTMVWSELVISQPGIVNVVSAY